MTALLRFFSFPLLAKELTEAAARRRTYVLRVVYGALLFAVFAALAVARELRSALGDGRGAGDV